MFAMLTLMKGFVSAVYTSIIISITLTAKMFISFSHTVCCMFFLWFISLSKLYIGPWIINAISSYGLFCTFVFTYQLWYSFLGFIFIKKKCFHNSKKINLNYAETGSKEFL